MLLVLEQELAWGAAERSYCPEQSAETLTASLAFYLVEARVSIRGWERAGDGCCKPCLCGMKELPVKVAGKVPARVFTAEVKPWLFFFFFMQALTCPLAIGQHKRLAAFSCSWRTTLRTAEGRNAVEGQQQLFAWKESCCFAWELSWAITA